MACRVSGTREEAAAGAGAAGAVPLGVQLLCTAALLRAGPHVAQDELPKGRYVLHAGEPPSVSTGGVLMYVVRPQALSMLGDGLGRGSDDRVRPLLLTGSQLGGGHDGPSGSPLAWCA